MNKEALYEELKNRIISQIYMPEQVLNEKELMRTFDVGRTPLREVLFDLQRDGLVSIVPRYGTFVAPLSLNDLKNLIQVRPTLERLVAEILCDNITQAQLDQIEETLSKAEALIAKHGGKQLCDPATITEVRNLEAKLHNSMYEATSNPYLIYICRQLQANSERYWTYANMDTNGLINQIEDHRNLHEAIKKRQKSLSGELAENHTINFTQRVLSSLAAGR